jgi:hypothetical protein
VAIAFEGLREAQESALADVLARCGDGPVALAASGPDAALGAAPGEAGERRRQRRASFSGRVLTLQDQARDVLLGRDISPDGMRVEAHPELRPGQRLQLEICAAPGQPPIALRARVARNDGAAGVALRFEALSADAARRIEELVARLPAVEPLQDGECAALGSVVSRVLARETPES